LVNAAEVWNKIPTLLVTVDITFYNVQYTIMHSYIAHCHCIQEAIDKKPLFINYKCIESYNGSYKVIFSKYQYYKFSANSNSYPAIFLICTLS